MVTVHHGRGRSNWKNGRASVNKTKPAIFSGWQSVIFFHSYHMYMNQRCSLYCQINFPAFIVRNWIFIYFFFFGILKTLEWMMFYSNIWTKYVTNYVLHCVQCVKCWMCKLNIRSLSVLLIDWRHNYHVCQWIKNVCRSIKVLIIQFIWNGIYHWYKSIHIDWKSSTSLSIWNILIQWKTIYIIEIEVQLMLFLCVFFFF